MKGIPIKKTTTSTTTVIRNMDLASILRPFVIGIVCNEYEFVKKKLTTTNSKKKKFFFKFKSYTNNVSINSKKSYIIIETFIILLIKEF